MTATTQRMTADELLGLPDDGLRRELVRGELRTMAPAGNTHGRISMRFAWRLAHHVELHDLGTVLAAETGFRLSSDPDTVRAPDVAFVGQPRLLAAGRVEGFWPGAPDLAVEVLSPGDSFAEVEEKVRDWLAAGTRLVVVANPAQRTLTVYRSLSDIRVLQEGETLDAGDVVPGWRVPVAEIFG
ncbi:MAG: Uma2 family endonuclease [Candidatus Latescibacterota bacterium]